jgi:hypothetical protein
MIEMRRSIGLTVVRNGVTEALHSAADIVWQQKLVMTERTNTSDSGTRTTPSSLIIHDMTTSGSGDVRAMGLNGMVVGHI